MMQLTEKTLSILKNFASINQNFVFTGTNIVRTVAESRSIMGQAVLESAPEDKIGIYDLNEFLSTMNLVDNPKLDFKKDFVEITDSSGRSRVKYYFSDPDMLTYPKKDVVPLDEGVKFELDLDTLNKLKRASSTLGHDLLRITPSGSNLLFSIVDPENSTANDFSMDHAGSFDEGSDFTLYVSIANLKMLPGDYNVVATKKLFMYLENKNDPIQYYVALEKTSEFN